MSKKKEKMITDCGGIPMFSKEEVAYVRKHGVKLDPKGPASEDAWKLLLQFQEEYIEKHDKIIDEEGYFSPEALKILEEHDKKKEEEKKNEQN